MPPIAVPELGDSFHGMWLELIELARLSPAPWTLVGAHMVDLHGWAAGRDAPRASRDADVLVNVRAAARGTEQVSALLVERGYQVTDVSATGLGHSFSNGDVEIDVLAPDGIGNRVSTRTVGTLRTVRVPGGSQALQRTFLAEIRSRTTDGAVPVPSLLGALLIKVRAIDVADDPDAHRQDAAFLTSLVEDPDSMAAECSKAERGWLLRHRYFADPEDPAWRALEDPEGGAIIYRRLIERSAEA